MIYNVNQILIKKGLKNMETNITQLKQEQMVGNETVYEDIMPKTISSAVFDNNDVPLDELISRMWNSINNKLKIILIFSIVKL